MAELVHRQNDNGVLRLTLAGPGGNALDQPMRTALFEALAAARDDDAVRGVVLAGAGADFCRGTPAREFDPDGQAAPTLADICTRLEALDRPVVAALHGAARGGGLELALAAHYRVAARDVRLAFPDVRRDLPPAAGASQRLPRLIPARKALSMLLDGVAVGAEEAQEAGLVDALADPDEPAVEAAGAMARGLLEAGAGPRPTSGQRGALADPVEFEGAVRAARERSFPAHCLAPPRIIDSVEAALVLPFVAGVAFEATAWLDCAAGEAAAGLTHAVLSEAAAARLPAGAEHVAAGIMHLGVAGGSLRGAGLVASALEAGLPVTLVEDDPETLKRALERVAVIQDRAVRAGRLDAQARDEAWDRLSGATDIGALARCGLVLEAAATDGPRPPETVLAAVAGTTSPDTVLASLNIPPEALAEAADALDRPRTLLALSQYHPSPSTRLVELGFTDASTPQAVADMVSLLRGIGRVPVRVRGGSIAARLVAALDRAADTLLALGVAPGALDAALVEFGFSRGPLAQRDMAPATAPAATARDPVATFRAALDAGLKDAGRTGYRVGRGIFDYDSGGHAQPAPEVAAILETARESAGMQGAPPPGEEIRQRVLAALANAGAHLLEEGVALRPSDIDVAAVQALGFPRWRGGPLHMADRLGMVRIRKVLKRARAADAALWAPAPMIDEMLRNGWRFADFEAA